MLRRALAVEPLGKHAARQHERKAGQRHHAAQHHIGGIAQAQRQRAAGDLHHLQQRGHEQQQFCGQKGKRGLPGLAVKEVERPEQQRRKAQRNFGVLQLHPAVIVQVGRGGRADVGHPVAAGDAVDQLILPESGLQVAVQRVHGLLLVLAVKALVVKAAVLLVLCGFAVIALVTIEALHTQISSLFLGKDGTAFAYQVSGDYMRWLGYFFIFMGIKMATDGVLRGLGIMRPFLVANIVNLAIRLSVALICAPRFGIAFVWLAIPVGWLANFLISYVALRRSWPTDKMASIS